MANDAETQAPLSETAQTALIDVGEPVRFGDGDVLRQKGVFAPDMLLITEGRVACLFSDDDTVSLTIFPGAIVGEIGFLTGMAANATLRADGEVLAVSMDAATLAKLQQQKPEAAAEILRALAHLMQERNRPDRDGTDEGEVQILRCSTLDQMRMAQRLRYEVGDRGQRRESAAKGLITDDRDATGTTFVALTNGYPMGTLRVNMDVSETSSEASLWAVRESEDAQVVLEKMFAAAIPMLREAGVGRICVNRPGRHTTHFEAIGFEAAGSATLDQLVLTIEANGDLPTSP